MGSSSVTKPNRKEGRKGNVVTATLSRRVVCAYLTFPLYLGK